MEKGVDWGWMLLSRTPVIGTPLTAAGILREPFPMLLALVAVAKIAHYLAVGALTPDSW
jgi:membrane protein YqaA with SNARE-associated domain